MYIEHCMYSDIKYLKKKYYLANTIWKVYI